MKLRKIDIKYLRDCGYDDADIRQICDAMENTEITFKYCGKYYGGGYETRRRKISMIEAYELLGRKRFLDGISDSAFHWGASKWCKNGVVEFDSCNMFV